MHEGLFVHLGTSPSHQDPSTKNDANSVDVVLMSVQEGRFILNLSGEPIEE
jgi:hypothetical protein